MAYSDYFTHCLPQMSMYTSIYPVVILLCAVRAVNNALLNAHTQRITDDKTVHLNGLVLPRI